MVVTLQLVGSSIDNNGHHEMVADVDLPGALKKDNCYMKEDLVGVSLRIIMSV